jgi:nitrate/nitrite-specific signal transduction histidine kinase
VSLGENELEANLWCQWLLHTWSLDPLSAQALAVMDELLSNARRHGRGSVRVDVQQRGRRVRIGVRDEGPGPMREDGIGFPPQNAAHGLGRIAEASHFWGVSRHPEGGTTVWSELDMTDQPPKLAG